MSIGMAEITALLRRLESDADSDALRRHNPVRKVTRNVIEGRKPTTSGGTVRTSAIIGILLAGVLALAGCRPNQGPSNAPPAPGTPPASQQQGGGY